MVFDVAIIGAGPAGAAAARVLAAAGRSVAIVEKSAFPRRKVCGEFMSGANGELLDRLGIGAAWRDRAGPRVRRVGLFAGEAIVSASVPSAGENGLGRALGRDVLDGLLLDSARAAGAVVFQPWRAAGIERQGNLQVVHIASGAAERTLHAFLVIAAHGSWDAGSLPGQQRGDGAAADLLGFKAHFSGSPLPGDLMPLIAFPGGYGGLVWSDDSRLSLSLCIRRGVLAERRAASPGAPAADVVLRHVSQSCRGVREALAGARVEGRWLAAGPIRPGIRPRFSDGVVRVGNAAGEAHPIIAEGIGMAMQAGWLLGRHLEGVDLGDPAARAAAGQSYAAAWRRQFLTRIVAAGVFARLAALPNAARLLGPLIVRAPVILRIGAALSGKARQPVLR